MNEQIFNIPLDSTIELTREDMLVSADEPKFHFNDQVFEGGLMANSFKFEGDGYVAGHYLYRFIDNIIGKADTNYPNGVVSKYDKTVILRDKNTSVIIAMFMFNDYKNIFYGGASIKRQGDYYIIEGTTEKGNAFKMVIDAYTYVGSLEKLGDSYQSSVDKGQDSFNISINKLVSSLDFITYRFPRIIDGNFNLYLQRIEGNKWISGKHNIVVENFNKVLEFNVKGLTLKSQAYTPDKTIKCTVKNENEIACAAESNNVDTVLYYTRSVNITQHTIDPDDILKLTSTLVLSTRYVYNKLGEPVNEIIFDRYIDKELLDIRDVVINNINKFDKLTPDDISLSVNTYNDKRYDHYLTKEYYCSFVEGFKPRNIWIKVKKKDEEGNVIDTLERRLDTFINMKVLGETKYGHISGLLYMGYVLKMRIQGNPYKFENINIERNFTLTKYTYSGDYEVKPEDYPQPSDYPQPEDYPLPTDDEETKKKKLAIIAQKEKIVADKLAKIEEKNRKREALIARITGVAHTKCAAVVQCNEYGEIFIYGKIFIHDGSVEDESKYSTLEYDHIESKINGDHNFNAYWDLTESDDTNHSFKLEYGLLFTATAKSVWDGVITDVQLNSKNEVLKDGHSIRQYTASINGIKHDKVNTIEYKHKLSMYPYYGCGVRHKVWVLSLINYRSESIIDDNFPQMFDIREKFRYAAYYLNITKEDAYDVIDYTEDIEGIEVVYRIKLTGTNIINIGNMQVPNAIINDGMTNLSVSADVSRMKDYDQPDKYTQEITYIIKSPYSGEGIIKIKYSAITGDMYIVENTSPYTVGNVAIKKEQRKMVLTFKIKNDKEYTVSLVMPYIQGSGTVSDAALNKVELNKIYVKSGKIGDFILENNDMAGNGDYYIVRTSSNDSDKTYYIAQNDRFIGSFGMRGMIYKKHNTLIHVSYSEYRHEFKDSDEVYYVEIDRDTRSKLDVVVSDIIKDRKNITLNISDASYTKTITEVMSFTNEPEERESIREDKSDLTHNYYITHLGGIVEITGNFIRLYKDGKIIDTKDLMDVYPVISRYELLRTGVTSANNCDTIIYGLYVENDATNNSKFILCYAITKDTLNYEGSWVKKEFLFSSANQSGALTYYGSKLYASQVIASSVISAVSYVKGGTTVPVIGIKYQRGMNQWTLFGDGSKIVNGFGSVGINRLITGNWLPLQCCNGDCGFDANVINEAINFDVEGCYNVSGTILFHYKNIKGYVYAIGLDGTLYSQSELESQFNAIKVMDKQEVEWATEYYETTIPLGKVVGQIISNAIYMPIYLLWSLTLGKLPKLIRPKPPKRPHIPDEFTEIFDLPGLGGSVIFNGVSALSGAWFSANTWLTGARTGQQVWNPKERVKSHIKFNISDSSTTMLQAFANIGGNLARQGIDKAIKGDSSASSEGTSGRPARMTQVQADQIKAKLGRLVNGRPGGHSDKDIERYAAEAGVTDPSIIQAIQQSSWNSDGKNKTWRQGIDSLVDEGEPGKPAQAVSEKSGDAPTIGVKETIPKAITSTLSGLIDSFTSDSEMEVTATSELHVIDDIIPACYPEQNVYSGPGYFSIQLVRANRRLMDYQHIASWSANGGTINLFSFLGGLELKILGCGIQVPNTPPFIKREFGASNYTKAKTEDMEWLGGQHLYMNGPLSQTQVVHFIEPSSDIIVQDEEIEWRPREDNIHAKKWEWKDIRKEKAISLKGGIVLGNRSGYDKEGFARTKAPVFSTPIMYDALLLDEWGLYCTYVGDDIIHLSIDDTKIIDGAFSNIVCKDGSLYIASMYNVLKVDYGVSANSLSPKSLLRGLALNKTGINWIQKLQLMHAFDGYGNRILEWVGEPGSDIEILNSVTQYLPFKESMVLHSMFPPTAVFGKFNSLPHIAYNHSINIVSNDNSSIIKGTGVDTRLIRISIPLFFKRISDYPAGIQTVGTYKLFVVDGVTSLTTDSRSGYMRSLNDDVDVMIYGNVYRAFNEYLSLANQKYGMLAFRDIALKIGQKVLGADTKSILLFSRITRQLYLFSNDETINKQGTAYRVKDFDISVYEFLRQELIIPTELINKKQPTCIMRFDNLTAKGMIPEYDKPIIDRFGCEAGYVMQAKGTAQVAFNIFDENMMTLYLKDNRGKWEKVQGDNIDDFFSKRRYGEVRPFGYFWEPFRLATAFIGVNDSTDMQFEWVITFAYTEWMHSIIDDRYVTVFLACETACPNGHRRSEVTKVRLRNDMFQRTDEQIGYYSFRFNGRNGAGNSERLFIWSDGLVSLRKLELITRVVTEARTSPMLTQPDFSAVEEL